MKKFTLLILSLTFILSMNFKARATTNLFQNPTIEQVIDTMDKAASCSKIANKEFGYLYSLDLTKESDLKKAFDFIDKRISYKNDEIGFEQIKTPLRVMLDGTGDCDDYSTLWKHLLNYNNIKSHFKICNYSKNNSWEHVYIIIPLKNGSYIPIDSVLRKPLKEVNYVKSRIF